MKKLLGGDGGREGFGSAIEEKVFEDFKERNVGREASTKFRCNAAEGCHKLFKGYCCYCCCFCLVELV